MKGEVAGPEMFFNDMMGGLGIYILFKECGGGGVFQFSEAKG